MNSALLLFIHEICDWNVALKTDCPDRLFCGFSQRQENSGIVHEVISPHSAYEYFPLYCSRIVASFNAIGQRCTNPGCQVAIATKLCRWHLIFLGPRHWTSFMSPIWSPEFWGGLYIFGIFMHPWYEKMITAGGKMRHEWMNKGINK